ncbi:MAG TPA: HAMP domain-containing protein, partial [Planctomycetaceae bacterium]|nr:HAMP domain-containing protein [Planctomycetaceae bacterium]
GVQEARRYEKNYFLYGSEGDLYDALAHIHAAAVILERTTDIRAVLNANEYRDLSQYLGRYESLLGELATRDFGGRGPTGQRDPGVEKQIRYFGHQILTYAADMVRRERNNMRRTASSLQIVAICALVLNLIVMLWVATELTRQILRPLGRAVEYTQRIARGDFSLITPKRKYRREFSNLAVAINRMILELRRNQERLLQSRKMAAVGTLTPGIAHELNNPLNNISITAEALLDGLENYSREEIRKMLKDIFTQTERAGATVRNLLDFTRAADSGTEPVDVKELIGASLRLVGNELAINHIETRTEFSDHLPPVRGSFRTLQQVFLNLFLDAVQAIPDGGRLEVRAEEDGENYVRIDVADTGCGMPEENRDRIFEPFFTTKPVGEGTGLGLSVSYGIVQKIGGRIEVESEVGKGTVFSVFLVTEGRAG